MAGILSCNHDEATDLLLVLSPREDSFCRGQTDPVWSCHYAWFCRWALTSSRMDRTDLTSSKTTHTEKAPSSPCAAEEVYFGQGASWCQRRHRLRGVNHEQSEVLQLAVRTSTHPHWCCHMLTPKLLMDTALKLMNSQHKTPFTVKFIHSYQIRN